MTEIAERIQGLEDDIAELKLLTLESERPNIQNHLAQLLSKLKTELEKLQSAQVKVTPIPVAVTPVKEEDKINYIALTKYAWDQ